MTALGPLIGEADGLQSAYDLTDRQVRQGWAHAAPGSWKEVTRGVLVTNRAGSSTSSRYSSNCLSEISEGLVDRRTLAGDVDLQALRDVPVLFSVHGRGKAARHRHVSRIALATERGWTAGLRRRPASTLPAPTTRRCAARRVRRTRASDQGSRTTPVDTSRSTPQAGSLRSSRRGGATRAGCRRPRAGRPRPARPARQSGRGRTAAASRPGSRPAR